MGKSIDVEDLPLDLGEELNKLSADALPAESVALGERSRQFLLARLAILDRIRKLCREEQARVVDELRSLPVDERGKWSEIGEALGINPGAAAKRYTGTPRAGMDKPGYSLSEAAALLGKSLSTVHAKVHAAEPDAKWLTLVRTNGEVRTKEYRILDLTGLDATTPLSVTGRTIPE